MRIRDLHRPVSPLADPQVATSTAVPAAAPGARPAPVADDGAIIDADDQSGYGTAVVVRDARVAGGPGRVVIRTDDDRDGRVLGAAAVGRGGAGPSPSPSP